MINMVVVSMYGVHQKKASRREGDKPSGNYRRVPWLAQCALISALNASEEELTQMRGVIDEALSNEFHRIDVGTSRPRLCRGET